MIDWLGVTPRDPQQRPASHEANLSYRSESTGELPKDDPDMLVHSMTCCYEPKCMTQGFKHSVTDYNALEDSRGWVHGIGGRREEGIGSSRCSPRALARRRRFPDLPSGQSTTLLLLLHSAFVYTEPLIDFHELIQD